MKRAVQLKNFVPCLSEITQFYGQRLIVFLYGTTALLPAKVWDRDGNGWQIFADEGENKNEELMVWLWDPLKAYHTVKGVTAREMCHYFFMPEFRNDWEKYSKQAVSLICYEKSNPIKKLNKSTYSAVENGKCAENIFNSDTLPVKTILPPGTN
ncbi:Collagen type IV alpha-3-binding protein [Lucilia cuprina]|nr:Collagen type IV alpha-3-binding protein [Lucilia cuprina]